MLASDRSIAADSGTRVAGAVGLALIGAGAVARLAPLVLGEERLLRQFPTEDGYLMLTIARNLAAGLGMSTAAGTMPTNGTQPLMTFVYSLGFLASGGDRESGVAIALVLQLAIALASAWFAWRLGRRLFERHPRGAALAAIAVGSWFASSFGVRHSMNCLETGAFALLVLAFADAWTSPADPLGPWSVRRSIGMGALLGLSAWARIDAVFLVAAACVARAVLGPGSRWRLTREQLASAVWMGATAVLAISPWLIHNHVEFGSVMPVSGRAEASFEPAGSNWMLLPVVLAEYLLVVFPVPNRFESHPAAVAVGVALVAGAAAASIAVFRRSEARVRAAVALVGLYALGMSIYYGGFFSVAFFLTRYMFPLAIFAALLSVTIADRALAAKPLRALALAGAVAALAFANLRLFKNGLANEHFQVVEWTRANVRDDEWMAAVQTGTLGFFHDRSINLDGKVNPAAFEALQRKSVPDYVAASPARYIADWASLSAWAEIPVIAEHFELIVNDPQLDLAVFRRRSEQ